MAHTRLIRAAKDIDNDSGVDEDIDPSELRSLKKSGGSALGFMPDHGEGDIKFWRIDNNAPVAAEPNGILLGSKAYVLKYHFKKDGEEGYVIYFWQVSTRISNVSSDFSSLNSKRTQLISNRAKMRRLKIRLAQPFIHLNWIAN